MFTDRTKHTVHISRGNVWIKCYTSGLEAERSEFRLGIQNKEGNICSPIERKKKNTLYLCHLLCTYSVDAVNDESTENEIGVLSSNFG